MRRLESGLFGLLWSVLLLSLVVAGLAAPAVTAFLIEALDISGETGLGLDATQAAAEEVRAFVSSSTEALSRTPGSGLAFDDRAVAHLEDVRDVLNGTKAVAGIAALLLAAWVGVCSARSRLGEVARATSTGGWMTLAVIGVAAAFTALGFDEAFAAFHGLFFEEGTWLFPPDSPLIQLFPERFWVAMSATGGLLSAVGGVLLVLAGKHLSVRETR